MNILLWFCRKTGTTVNFKNGRKYAETAIAFFCQLSSETHNVDSEQNNLNLKANKDLIQLFTFRFNIKMPLFSNVFQANSSTSRLRVFVSIFLLHFSLSLSDSLNFNNFSVWRDLLVDSFVWIFYWMCLYICIYEEKYNRVVRHESDRIFTGIAD